jgi:hypothetical protein
MKRVLTMFAVAFLLAPGIVEGSNLKTTRSDLGNPSVLTAIESGNSEPAGEVAQVSAATGKSVSRANFLRQVGGEDTPLTFRFGNYFKDCAGISIEGNPDSRDFSKGDSISIWVGVEKSCLLGDSPEFSVSSIPLSNLSGKESLEVELTGNWDWHDSSFYTAWGTYFDYVVDETSFLTFEVATSHGDLQLGMLVRVLDPAPREFIDSADTLSGPKLHAVYVVPADVQDKRRDTRGEIESWILQSAALAKDRFGEVLRIDLDSGGDVDVLYMRSELTQREILNSSLEGHELLKEVKARVGVGLDGGVVALFVENSSALPESDYCGFAELEDFLDDEASSFVVGPLSQCDEHGADGFDYPATTVLHELLHNLGVDHVDTPNEGMCGDPFDCETRWDWDSGRNFYNGTTSSYSKTDIRTSKIWVSGNPTRPNPPSGLRVERGVGRITVQWDYPNDDGGGIVRSYLAIANPSGVRCWSGTNGYCTFNNLDTSTGYTFKVAAFNVFGRSDFTEQTKITYTAQVPSKPRGVRLQNTAQFSVSIAWSGIDGNGSNVARVEARHSLNSGKWSAWKSLSNGSKVTNKLWRKASIVRIEIRGINEVGVGPSSSTTLKMTK